MARLSSARSQAFAPPAGQRRGKDRIPPLAAVLSSPGARGLAFGMFFDRVHSFRVEGQVVPDGRHRVVGSLVGPDGVDGALPACRDTEVCAVTLVGAVGRMRAPLELRHINILARDVLDCRVVYTENSIRRRRSKR